MYIKYFLTWSRVFSSHFQGQMVLTERQHTHNLFHDKAKCAALGVKWNDFRCVIVNLQQLSSLEAKVNFPNFPHHCRLVVPLLYHDLGLQNIIDYYYYHQANPKRPAEGTEKMQN